METFLCCFSLRVGCAFIAILCVLNGVTTIVTYYAALQPYLSTTLGHLYVASGITIAFFSFVLLLGVAREEPCLITPWIPVAVGTLVFQLTGGVVAMLTVYPDNNKAGITTGIFLALSIKSLVYFIIAVTSYRKRVIQNEEFRRPIYSK